MKKTTDSLQGTLGLLILKALSRTAMHGYAIAQHIQQRSDEALRVEEGSLYPALHRMEQEGWIRSEWAMTETNRRARVYSITADGQSRLDQEEQSWRRLAAAVSLVLENS